MRRTEAAARCSWSGLTLSVALAGCSAVVEPDVGDLGPRPSACRPGDVNPFTCPDSAIVNQVCNAQGGFDAAPPCPPLGCNPGATAACRCSDGTPTTRTCPPDGAWPSCPCRTVGVAGALAPAPGG